MTIALRDQPVLLWGMMGTGKSTLVKELSGIHQIPTIDLDDEITAVAGCSVPDLIGELGLSEFRELERRTLITLLDAGRWEFIALGGGTLLEPDFRKEVRDRAFVISLFAEVPILAKRLEKERSSRPLIADATEDLEQTIVSLLAGRRNAYLDVDCVVDVSDIEPERCAIHLLGLFEDEAVA